MQKFQYPFSNTFRIILKYFASLSKSFKMRLLVLLLFLAGVSSEQIEGILDSLPSLVSELGSEGKILNDKDGSPIKVEQGQSLPMMPLSAMPQLPLGSPVGGSSKMLKVAALPGKKVALKKAAVAKAVSAPKLMKLPVAKLLKKPKVHSLKPIVHVVEKKVPVHHKVPVPKKVIVPKFYPVYKPIPVPKIIPVPFKVPVKKVIPKIVKIPKAIPIPKIVPVKKPVPIPIPYPVPKWHKVPIPKPIPYAKYIPVPIPKKVPKLIPIPVKKIIKVPKPYYVPVKVPHFTASYIKTPMAVNVPNIKKYPAKPLLPKPVMNLIPKESGGEMKFLDSNSNIEGKSLIEESMANLGQEDKELLKLLTDSISGDKNVMV